MRAAVGPVAGYEAGDPHIAERLQRAGRIVRALRAEERATVRVPGDHGITGARRADLLLRDRPYGDASSG